MNSHCSTRYSTLIALLTLLLSAGCAAEVEAFSGDGDKAEGQHGVLITTRDIHGGNPESVHLLDLTAVQESGEVVAAEADLALVELKELERYWIVLDDSNESGSYQLRVSAIGGGQGQLRDVKVRYRYVPEGERTSITCSSGEYCDAARMGTQNFGSWDYEELDGEPLLTVDPGDRFVVAVSFYNETPGHVTRQIITRFQCENGCTGDVEPAD